MELDLPGNDWSKPIVMLGDNDQATRWINHEVVSDHLRECLCMEPGDDMSAESIVIV